MRARMPDADSNLHEHGVRDDAGEHTQPPLSLLYGKLESRQWSLFALESLLPHVAKQALNLDSRDRTAWLAGLRRAFAQMHLLSSENRDRLFDILRCWCDWPMLIALDDRSNSDDHRPEVVDALFRNGQLDSVETRCRRRMLTHPHDVHAAGLYTGLLQWQSFIVARALPIEGQTLRLEPLGHHHCEAFSWQYWDPDIAKLCCLPVFANEAQWHCWLDECWGHGDQRLYAVLHREWGFVGSVSLVMHGEVGFFYYWIGRDFQGYGIGPEAVQLLLQAAREREGMRVCYAKAYENNFRSRRGMLRIGFDPLPFSVAPPAETEVFYRIGETLPKERVVAELRWLLARMGSDTRLAVPIC